MYEFVRGQEIYDLAVSVAIGFNDPKAIQSLRPVPPQEQLDMEALPAMLRIPQR
jgi:hypothetical protein